MEKQQLKPMLLPLLLIGSMAACSTGNSTPAMSGPASAALGSSVSQSSSSSSKRPALAAVDLRSARNYAILAGATVTSTGPSLITGNVGIFPGTAITGFPPGVINGKLRAGVPLAQQAQMDLTTAYNGAMGRTSSPITVAGNLGGQTLAPGLYKFTSSLAVSSGDLTLDAYGKPGAVFIFQMASTFTMTTGRAIILTGGAKASNIYWAVGSSATLGTGCSFYGNLLVHKSISMATGTVVTGRALARIGAVTMQSNTIVRPIR